MIRFFFSCLGFLLLAVIFQQWIPSFGASLYEGRILLLPLTFFCIALSQNYIATLIFAIITGFFWDLEHTIAPSESNSIIAEYTVDNLKFGYSVFLFGFLGFLIKFIQANFRYVGLVFYIVGTFLIFLVYLLLDNLFILFVRGMEIANYDIFYQILYSALFSTLLAPLILYLLDLVWKLFNPRENSLIQGLNTFIKKVYK